MSMETWYIAVADGGPLLTRARTDPAFGSYLGGPAYLGRDRWLHDQGELDAEFLAQVDAMNREHPGIEGRICTLGCDFDILHFLLSEGRRRGAYDEADLGTRSIRGGAVLPEHLRGYQGHPIRYTPPPVVVEVAGWLGGLTAGDLRSAYDPAAMEQRCVYKFRADRADGPTWDRIVAAFESLRAFYATVASHGEGVLVVVT